MQAFPIVIDFDVFKHRALGRLPGGKPLAMDRLDLEAVVLHEQRHFAGD